MINNNSSFKNHVYYQAFDYGEIASLSVIDLSKVFDSITHKILLDKLKVYDIRGVVNSLLESYLQNIDLFPHSKTSSSAKSTKINLKVALGINSFLISDLYCLKK